MSLYVTLPFLAEMEGFCQLTVTSDTWSKSSARRLSSRDNVGGKGYKPISCATEKAVNELIKSNFLPSLHGRRHKMVFAVTCQWVIFHTIYTLQSSFGELVHSMRKIMETFSSEVVNMF